MTEAMKDGLPVSSAIVFIRALPFGGQRPLKDGDVIGVSMTEAGDLMLGFRFRVDSLASRARGLEPPAWVRRMNE